MNLITRFASVFLCWSLFAHPGFAQTSTPTPVPDFLRDLNRDGVINSQDLLILIQRWGLQRIATPTPTHTLSPTPTPTLTSPPPPTETFTATPSPSATETSAPTSTDTPPFTPTETATETPTPSPTETPTNPDTLNIGLPTPFIKMVRIPAGSFLMGSPDTERSRQADEGPVHQVTIGYDFYLGETEVTQGQWEAVMGYNAATHSPEGTPYLTSFGVGRDYPVYKVSWDDCQAFLAGLNALGQGTFRLPSEAEWEYACRAGSTTRFYFGDSLGCFDACEDCDADPTIRGKRFPPELTGNPMEFEPKIVIPIELKRSDFMWYCGNSGGSSQPVRQKFANGFGLYDMHGNLWEWCQDLYRSDYDFAGIPIDGSAWESGGGDGTRVIRGGGWTGAAGYCRSAVRFRSDPTARHSDVGVRVVAPVSP